MRHLKVHPDTALEYETKEYGTPSSKYPYDWEYLHSYENIDVFFKPETDAIIFYDTDSETIRSKTSLSDQVITLPEDLFEKHPKNEYTIDECPYCDMLPGENTVCKKHASLRSVLDRSLNFTRHLQFPVSVHIQPCYHLHISDMVIAWSNNNILVVVNRGQPFSYRINENRTLGISEERLRNILVSLQIVLVESPDEMRTKEFVDYLDSVERNYPDDLHELLQYSSEIVRDYGSDYRKWAWRKVEGL